jgi:hypothetical protein
MELDFRFAGRLQELAVDDDDDTADDAPDLPAAAFADALVEA